MEASETATSSSDKGIVTVVVTVSGDDVTQQDADEAVKQGIAKALHAIGHVGENLYFASIKGTAPNTGPGICSQTMTLNGVTLEVEVSAQYDGVGPYVASMAIAGLPSTVMTSFMQRAFGMSKKDVLKELANVVGEEQLLARLNDSGPDDMDIYPMMPGMPPGFGRQPEPANNGSSGGTGQYL
jgi:hypothetical protein